MKDAIHHRKQVQRKVIQSLYRDSNGTGSFLAKFASKKKIGDLSNHNGNSINSDINSYNPKG